MVRRARRCDGCSIRPRPQGRSVPCIVRRLLPAFSAAIGVACGQQGVIDLLPVRPMGAASGASDPNCATPPPAATAPPSAPPASAPAASETSPGQPSGPAPPTMKPPSPSPGASGPDCEAGADCPAMPVCEVDSGRCIECLADSGRCIECRVNSDCPSEHPFCRASDQTCVDCLVNGDCGDPTKTCDPKSNRCLALPRCAATPGP